MTHPRPRRLRSMTLLSVATGALSIGLVGCSATNPIATQEEYQPADGTGVEIGVLRAGNLVLLSSAEGAVGTLIGYLTNDGDDTVTVEVGLTGETSPLAPPVELGGGETVMIGPDADLQLMVDSAPAPPGALVSFTVTSDDGTATVLVPVLDGTFPRYADLVPGETG